MWFTVDDVHAVWEERVAQGFALNERPFEIPPGWLITASDPDGNIVGLIDNTRGGMPR